MKRILALLLLAGLAPAAIAEPPEQPVYDMVSLQAEAHARVPNDLLMATMFVEMSNASPAKLAAAVNGAMNDAMKAGRDFPGVVISTGSQSTWPLYDKAQKLEGWRTRAELQIESKDFEAASRAIARLQSGLQLGGISFSLSPDTAAATENRLIDDAMKAFRERADIIARSLGARNWRVVNVNVGDGGRPMPMPMLRAMAMAKESAIPEQDMAAGEADLVVNVNGSIQLQR